MDPNEKVLELLGQIAKWSREAGLPHARQRADAALDSETKLRVYDALKDGTMTARKLENAGLGVRRETAQKLIDEWEEAGLIEPSSDPPKAAFTLRELGISPPPPHTPRGKAATK